MSAPVEKFIATCPFCGSDDCSPNSDAWHVWVDCDACGARGAKVPATPYLAEREPQIERAVSAWNKRYLATEAALRAFAAAALPLVQHYANKECSYISLAHCDEADAAIEAMRVWQESKAGAA